MTVVCRLLGQKRQMLTDYLIEGYPTRHLNTQPTFYHSDMRNISTLIAFCFWTFAVNAQILDPKRTVERKATNRANNRIDQSIDKGLDKAEEGIGNLFKKKDKKKKTEGDVENNNIENKDEEKSSAVIPENGQTKNSSTTMPFSAYSKFDFVPGGKVIALEDFTEDAVGDFPAKWNTNGSGEVVTIAGKEGKWLKFSGAGFFYPEFLGALDENCTMEFDLATTEAHQVQSLLYFIDSKAYPNLLTYGSANLVQVQFDPTGKTGIVCTDGALSTKLGNEKEQLIWKTPDRQFVKISVWRQKTRLRVYMNEIKVWDLARAFEASVPYRLIFGAETFYQENRELFISNIRVAKGAPDTRNKLITEGKFTTNGILFDVNSDKIKPESYGILKEIAQVMSENPTLKIRISGHTDGDGEEKSNLVLSQKRSISVKSALTKEFSIQTDRIETDGYGESKPVDNNNTPVGKANNRRVEFTRL